MSKPIKINPSCAQCRSAFELATTDELVCEQAILKPYSQWPTAYQRSELGACKPWGQNYEAMEVIA